MKLWEVYHRLYRQKNCNCIRRSIQRKTGGALLGDRIRMNAINNDRVYMRSLATRQSNLALSRYVKDTVNILKAGGYDLIILETSGIGQSDTEIIDHSM